MTLHWHCIVKVYFYFLSHFISFNVCLAAELFLVERNVSLFVVNNANWKQIFKESPDPIYRKISETMIVKGPIEYIDEKHRDAVLGQS